MLDSFAIEKYFHKGQSEIAHVIKGLVVNENEKLFELLDFENDRIFLEPFLFLYFNYRLKANFPLLQILWGYIPKKNRPYSIMVRSNTEGIVYLPNYGYLKTVFINREMELQFNQREILIFCDGDQVDFEVEELLWLEDDKVEILQHSCSLLNSVFINDQRETVLVTILNTDLFNGYVKQSLELLKLVNPVYYKILVSATRKVVCFNGSLNSFASMSAHGGSFLNVKAENGLIFFFDNIIHQCSHIVFNAISFKKEDWFSTSPATPLSKFTRVEDDYHDIYGRYHGLFTQTNINLTIDKCLDINILDGDELHELKGRFSSNMKRFKTALMKLDYPEMYSSIGTEWFRYFEKTYKMLYNKRKELIESINVENQPYVFDYNIFVQTNPR